MALADRQKLYKDFSEKRKNPVIAYITSGRPGAMFVTRGKIFGCRQPDMNFRVGTPKLSSKWE